MMWYHALALASVAALLGLCWIFKQLCDDIARPTYGDPDA